MAQHIINNEVEHCTALGDNKVCTS